MHEGGEEVQSLKRGVPTLRETSKEDWEGASERQTDDQDNEVS